MRRKATNRSVFFKDKNKTKKKKYFLLQKTTTILLHHFFINIYAFVSPPSSFAQIKVKVRRNFLVKYSIIINFSRCPSTHPSIIIIILKQTSINQRDLILISPYKNNKNTKKVTFNIVVVVIFGRFRSIFLAMQHKAVKKNKINKKKNSLLIKTINVKW